MAHHIPVDWGEDDDMDGGSFALGAATRHEHGGAGPHGAGFEPRLTPARSGVAGSAQRGRFDMDYDGGFGDAGTLHWCMLGVRCPKWPGGAILWLARGRDLIGVRMRCGCVRARVVIRQGSCVQRSWYVALHCFRVAHARPRSCGALLCGSCWLLTTHAHAFWHRPASQRDGHWTTTPCGQRWCFPTGRRRSRLSSTWLTLLSGS